MTPTKEKQAQPKSNNLIGLTHLCDALYAEVDDNGSLILLNQYDAEAGTAEEVLVLDKMRLQKLVGYMKLKGLL